MRVAVRCFAILRELAADRLELELPDGARLRDAWTAAVARHPALAGHTAYTRAARNGSYAGWDDALSDGDELGFLPPVSGGGARLSAGPIDVGALEAIAGPEHGAVVTFIGRARERSDDGREVVELEYEAYRQLAEQVLAEVVAEAEARWPGCRVAAAHRTGVVPIGEAAIAIVSAAPHRAAAYEANRFVIEAVKERLPIWKRERFADGAEWKRAGA